MGTWARKGVTQGRKGVRLLAALLATEQMQRAHDLGLTTDYGPLTTDYLRHLSAPACIHACQVEAEEDARLEAAQARQLLYKLGPEEAAAAAEAAAADLEDEDEDEDDLEQPQARSPGRAGFYPIPVGKGDSSPERRSPSDLTTPKGARHACNLALALTLALLLSLTLTTNPDHQP